MDALIFNDVTEGLEALLLFCERWIRPSTRHFGGNPDAARKLASVLFYVDTLSKQDALNNHQRATLANISQRSIAFAASAGVSVSHSPFDVLIASGHHLSEPTTEWARRAYVISIPVDPSGVEQGRLRRDREAAALMRRAEILRAEYQDQMTMPEQADELEREAAALRCLDEADCELKPVWVEVREAIAQIMDSVSLADVLSKSPRARTRYAI